MSKKNMVIILVSLLMMAAGLFTILWGGFSASTIFVGFLLAAIGAAGMMAGTES